MPSRIPLVIAVVLAAIVAFVLPVVCDGERPSDIDPHATNFELKGPEDGKLVVMIHGVSGPMSVFDRTVETLNAHGFRTLRFDLIGRGKSGRPSDSLYDLTAYVDQLSVLLGRVGAPAVFNIVGSSMGAMVATAFTRLNPQRIKRIALIGPAGFPLSASPLAKLMTVPTVGEWAMSVFGDRTLASHNLRYFYAPEKFADAQRVFVDQLAIAGTKRAILATFRHVPLQDYLEGYAALGHLPVPKLLIWGEEDAAFPFAHSEQLLPLLPGAQFVRVPKSGHLPQLEQPEIANGALVSFLEQPTP